MGANFTAKILGNAVSALNAQQAVIANAGNNIANVNTEGYVRRTVNLQTRAGAATGGFAVGNGVEVGELVRVADEFLNGIVRDAHGQSNSTQTQDDFIARVEEVFSLTGDANTIGSTLSEFFSAVDNLSVNPSSIELRTELLQRANDLVATIRSAYDTVADLQTEADRRLTVEINTVNALTSQIAELNGLISAREGTGNVAADERDRRDLLMQQLSEKISYESVENSDGAVLIYLPSGFPLVSGVTSRRLETTTSPSFNAGGMPPSLAGGVLNHVVYDYDTTGTAPAHIDLTQVLQEGTGIVGGLLRVRGFNSDANTSAFQADGPLVEVASRIESIARQLLVAFNQTYLGPDRNDPLTVGIYDPSSGDLNGNPPATFGLFTFTSPAAQDVDGDGLPELADLTASGFDNFASILNVAFTDPRRIAAARDHSAGPPAAAVYPQGDNQNLAAISALQSQAMNFATGSFSLSGTFGDIYNETVGHVGNLRSRSRVDASVAADNLATATTRRDEVSAVSLDEEFTNLIRFQKAFQASARMIRTADEMMDIIVSLI